MIAIEVSRNLFAPGNGAPDFSPHNADATASFDGVTAVQHCRQMHGMARRASIGPCSVSTLNPSRERGKRRTSMDTALSPAARDGRSTPDGSHPSFLLQRENSISGVQYLLAQQEQQQQHDDISHEQRLSPIPFATNIGDNKDRDEKSTGEEDWGCEIPQARSVSEDDIREIIDNDVAWHTIRSKIRRAQLVTSLGVAHVCKEYIKAEAVEMKRRRRATIDTASTEDERPEVKLFGMSRRLSLF